MRNNLDDYLKFIDQNGIGCLEISDGSMVIDHDYKCELIHRLKKDFKVLSEVGSKEEGILISPAKWIRMMRNELDAGILQGDRGSPRKRNGGHLPAQWLSPHTTHPEDPVQGGPRGHLVGGSKEGANRSGSSSSLAPM